MSRYIEEKDVIDGIRNNLVAGDYIYWQGDDVEDEVANFPTANVREVDAPKTYSEQLNLDCEFCRRHEQGDILYDWSDWDGGIGFDYISNIKFCPICGRELFTEREDQDDGVVSL